MLNVAYHGMRQRQLLGLLLILCLFVAGLMAGLFFLFQRGSEETLLSPQDSDVADAESNLADLSITNEIESFVEVAPQTYEIVYKYIICNSGSAEVFNLEARSWFNDSSLNFFTVISLSGGDGLTLNPVFDGKVDTNLLSGENSLAPQTCIPIYLKIRLHYGDEDTQFFNYVDVQGEDGRGEGTSSESSSRHTTSRTIPSIPSSTSTVTSFTASTSASSTDSGDPSISSYSTTSYVASTTLTITVSVPAIGVIPTSSAGDDEHKLYDFDLVTFSLAGPGEVPQFPIIVDGGKD